MPTFLHLLLTSLFLLFPSSSVQLQPTEFFFDGFTGADKVDLRDTDHMTRNGIVQLTDTNRRRSTAHLFYFTPIPFKDRQNRHVRSFSTAFTFSMVPESQNIGWHGMAFTLSPAEGLYHKSSTLPALLNPVYMGDASDHIFAVEFVSFKDLEFDDLDDNHVGINLNNSISSFIVPAAYFTDDGTKVNVSFVSQDRYIQAWVDYDSDTSVINVTISPSAFKPKIPLMSHKINLSSIVQDSMYVGFSCMTRLVASSDYLLGWSFNTSGPARSLPMTKPPLPSGPKKSRVALAIALSISFCSALIACCLYLVR